MSASGLTGLLGGPLQLLAQTDAAEPAVAATTSGTAEVVVFWIVAPLALGTAIAMVVLRNAVHAALMLVLNFFTIAVLYAVLEAQFVAVVQIIVYAGAIMVLFLFVIMLLGIDRAGFTGQRLPGQRIAAVLLGLALAVGLVAGVATPWLGPESACVGAPEGAAASAGACEGLAAVNAGEEGNPGAVGRLLFTDYVWPFEVMSVLLVIAALGAIVLGRRHEDPRDLVDVAPPEPVQVGARPLPTDVGGDDDRVGARRAPRPGDEH